MLSGFDHVVVAVKAIEPGIEAYRTLLGRSPSWRAAGEGGVAVAMFALANITIELMAPVDEGPVADRLSAVLDAQGEGLASLAFAAEDLTAAHRVLGRVGLSPEPIAAADSFDAFTGRIRKWRRTRSAAAAARSRLENSQQNTVVFERQLEQQVRTALADLDALAQQVEPARLLVAATEDVVASYLRQYQVGKKNWLDVLNALRESAQAHYSAVDVASSTQSLQLRLMLLTGPTSSQALGLIHD
jgi:hypothetical protein